jgi:hypothetical protein
MGVKHLRVRLRSTQLHRHTLGLPPLGYEGMLVLAGLTIWIGLLCIAATIVLSGIILLKRRGVPVTWPVIGCTAAGQLMFMAVR